MATLDNTRTDLQRIAAGLDGLAPADEPGPHVPRAEPEPAPASRTALSLGDLQRRVCEQVVNAFETGSVTGNYGAITIFNDGPGDVRQITYGRSQTTEYGNLRQLVAMYVDAGGTEAAGLRPYLDRIGRTPLVDDRVFKALLVKAGREDPLMWRTQDTFFDIVYFQPALEWASARAFTRALSMLVIYDSWIHSGGILGFLRRRFAEVPPASGGDEKTWITEYVRVRHAWLRTHRRPAVRASSYRTRDLGREVGNGNWDLDRLPINANGILVHGSEPMLPGSVTNGARKPPSPVFSEARAPERRGGNRGMVGGRARTRR